MTEQQWITSTISWFWQSAGCNNQIRGGAASVRGLNVRAARPSVAAPIDPSDVTSRVGIPPPPSAKPALAFTAGISILREHKARAHSQRSCPNLTPSFTPVYETNSHEISSKWNLDSVLILVVVPINELFWLTVDFTTLCLVVHLSTALFKTYDKINSIFIRNPFGTFSNHWIIDKKRYNIKIIFTRFVKPNQIGIVKNFFETRICLIDFSCTVFQRWLYWIPPKRFVSFTKLLLDIEQTRFDT